MGWIGQKHRVERRNRRRGKTLQRDARRGEAVVPVLEPALEIGEILERWRTVVESLWIAGLDGLRFARKLEVARVERTALADDATQGLQHRHQARQCKLARGCGAW